MRKGKEPDSEFAERSALSLVMGVFAADSVGVGTCFCWGLCVTYKKAFVRCDSSQFSLFVSLHHLHPSTELKVENDLSLRLAAANQHIAIGRRLQRLRVISHRA